MPFAKLGVELLGSCDLKARNGCVGVVGEADAVDAVAERVTSVSELHGWRAGRVVDPFGHHWEIA